VLRYRLSTDAIADLEAISDYLQERNPDAAERVVSSIFAAIKRACNYPAAGPEIDESSAVPGTRKLIEAQYRYVIYYRVVQHTLIVVRVFHGSRGRNP
jgi:plasmid stabilization system protein ParE